MSAMQEIEDLPDFPALQQIQRALWESEEMRGAAVLVGAGFSLNALRPAPTSPKPPLWDDFNKAMAKRIYPNTKAPDDTLRLAEEYKAELGPAALEALINDLVRDTEWLPGALHEQLLSLPWKDVLTTNWDTLLERAAETTDQQTYEVVRTIADIPKKRSPRIVKLHGSMPSNRPFIFTEEDYRTYPNNFAPFVNLAQQVLLENELCLIGFSGHDPNFLRWSGWIRDELGAAARRIYLVGALDLSSSQRKLLEARNVSPVDLASLVRGFDPDERHAKASKLFLDFLQRSKPKPLAEWSNDESWALSNRLLGAISSAGDISALTNTFRQLISVWKKEREAYPGWLICPSDQRRLMRLNSGNFEFTLKRGIGQLTPEERTALLYEMMWRLDLSFAPVSHWLQDLLQKTVEDDTSKLSRRQRCELGEMLLRMAREIQNRALFDHWCEFLRIHGHSDEDVLARVAYESSLWARDHLDFPSLSQAVRNMKGSDPIWKTRSAALLYELGDSETAAGLATEAVKELRKRHSRDRKSIWTISRLAWALFLARAEHNSSLQPHDSESLISSTEWPEYYTRNKCLPWDELDALDRELSGAWRIATENRDLQPRFDPGSYRRVVRFSDAIPFAKYDVVRVADIAGIPARLYGRNVSVEIMRSRLAHAIELSEQHDERELLQSIRVLKGASDELMEKTVDSIGVARMPFATAEAIINTLWGAITFGLSRTLPADTGGHIGSADCWIDRLEVFIEVLSRLVVRLPSDRAIAAFQSATRLSGASALGPGHWRLFVPLGNLLRRAFSAIAPSDRANVLLEILSLPLPDEKGIQGQSTAPSPANDWPELMLSLQPILGRSSNEVAFAARVSTLIAKTRTGDSLTQQRASIRLAYLTSIGTLTAAEEAGFRSALQVISRSDAELPFAGALFPDVLLAGPNANKAKMTKVFRNTVLKQLFSGFDNPETLRTVALATLRSKNGSRSLTLTRDEALKLFDMTMEWQPTTIEPNLDTRQPLIMELAGRILAGAVLPSLNSKMLGNDRIDRLFAKIQTAKGFDSLLLALPGIVRLERSREKSAVELIQQAFLSRDRDKVAWALSAINQWRTLRRPPQKLKQFVVAIIAAGRDPWLSSALSVAIHLLDAHYLSQTDKKELVHALDGLRLETAYSTWDRQDLRTGTIAWIRARCVQLSAKLQAAGVTDDSLTAWMNDAKNDALPEVRYALEVVH